MGKITLAVLVVAIALGVYWFWWSDQGANNPIAVEGTLSVAGMPATPGMQGPQTIDFSLQALPNRLKAGGNVQGKEMSAIIDLRKRKMYVLNESKRTYAEEEFELVDMTQTKREDLNLPWPKEFKRTPDWDHIGTGEGKWFCNKQTLKELPKELADAAKTSGTDVPGAAMMEAVLKNINAEIWFTPDTRLGRRYFSMLNKLTRICKVGKGTAEKEKRPQFQYVNLDYFPIPMKATLSLGPMRIEMEVKSLSRKKIPKDAFDIPSNYKKVSMREVSQ